MLSVRFQTALTGEVRVALPVTVWIGTPVALVTVNVQVCDVIAPALTVNEPLAICALVALTCGATKPAPIAAMMPVRMSGSRA